MKIEYWYVEKHDRYYARQETWEPGRTVRLNPREQFTAMSACKDLEIAEWVRIEEPK